MKKKNLSYKDDQKTSIDKSVIVQLNNIYYYINTTVIPRLYLLHRVYVQIGGQLRRIRSICLEKKNRFKFIKIQR